VDGLLTFDLEVFRFIHVGLHHPLLTPIMWAFSYSGLGQVQVLLSLVFLRWRSTERYVFPLICTVIGSGLVLAQGLKRVLPRDRPSNLAMAAPQEEFYGRAFPSGHTTTAFAVAFMLLWLTWGSPRRKLAYWALVWASLVGISRVYRGVHWPTDVIGGACAGAIGSTLLYLLFFRNRTSGA
jgi:undecaprenyl-diphosphatase